MEQNMQSTQELKRQSTSNENGSGENQIIEEKISKVNGEVAIKKYQKGKMLGKGGFAKCYEVTNLENKKVYAAKIIQKSTLTKNRARQKLISEIKIHKSLHHSNVVGFEHVFEDHENVYILLEICSNQTLNELLKRRKRLTELEVQCYVSQLIGGLKYLHQSRVIHRDLKLGNLFLGDKMDLQIGDFGLATKLEFDGEKKRTICGTPNYIAPEILDGKTGHSYEVDVWSLGVIIYTLIIGKPPFETPDVKTTYKKIRMNSYSFPDNVPISEASRSLITKILNLDPAKRPTLDEIMAHPFINNGGTIPKYLPLSTLACPPSASYIKQFLPQGNTGKLSVNQQPQRILSETQSSTSNPKQIKDAKNPNMLSSTDKWSTTQTNNFGQNTQSVNFKDGFRPNTTQKNNNNEIKGFQSTKTLPSNFQTQTNFTQSISNFNKTGAIVSQVNGGSNKPSSYKSEVWVKKWVDYSSKYGLGYLLSNGSTGVFFNDSTKIILHAKGNYFEYMERRMSDRQDIVSSYTLTDYPRELLKKVTLLQHFRNYLEGDNRGQSVSNDTIDNDDINKNQPLIYLKKWMKTRHAIMFRLSNKIVQVNFTDKTEVILSSEHKMLTYVNKKGERSNYPLATALESNNTEMTKRLKYTKEILAHMLNNPQNTNQESTKQMGSTVNQMNFGDV